MTYNNQLLEEIWNIEMDILDVVHKICQSHDLKYTLGFGSLIGAVRHGGFIPWDDDIDIVMPRSDYEILLKIWNDVAPADFIIQHKDIDRDFEQNFTKIRKDHTTFLQDEYEKTKLYHKGIFIDIAPCDRLAPGKFSRKIQHFACAVELLYSKEHTSGNGGITGIVERLLLLLPQKWRPAIRRKARSTISKWISEKQSLWFCSDTIQNCSRYFSHDLFDELVLMPYQGRQYFAISKPDDFLRVRYGDYMQLPPEEDRVWKHHPIMIDFNHNYEELAHSK